MECSFGLFDANAGGSLSPWQLNLLKLPQREVNSSCIFGKLCFSQIKEV